MILLKHDKKHICVCFLLYNIYGEWYYWLRQPDGGELTYTPRFLNNSNATKNTNKLFDYLNTSYGEKILSGQNIALNPNGEMNIIYSVTGKYPAICSFDVANLSSLSIEYSSQDTSVLTDAILDWARSGGILSLYWHWFSPSGIHNNENWPWYKSFYTKATSFDVRKIFDSYSKEYKQMIDDIDLIAQFLLELQKHDIPVLWRPLHEAAGGWFWWGAGGKEAYFELWHTMFERLTAYHGLNNLIWIWNGENDDWYVGDDYAESDTMLPPKFFKDINADIIRDYTDRINILNKNTKFVTKELKKDFKQLRKKQRKAQAQLRKQRATETVIYTLPAELLRR